MLTVLRQAVNTPLRLPVARTSLRSLSTTRSIYNETRALPTPASVNHVSPPWSTPDARLQAYDQNSTATGFRPYVIVALDKQEPSTLEKRLAVRATHLAEAQGGMRVGRILNAGGLLGSLDFPPTTAPAQQTANALAGSLFVVLAENTAEVWGRIQRDVYYRHGVWDPENTTIMPFAMASLPPAPSSSSESETTTKV